MVKYKNLEKIEDTVASWYDRMPHLPKEWRDWLAGNVWWLALVGAVVSALGLIVIVPALTTALDVAHYGESLRSMYGSSYYDQYGGMAWFSLMLGMFGYIVSTILLSLSVNNLKDKKKLGWRLLFWSYAANFVLNVIGAVVLMRPYSALMSVASAAVGAYFLVEIRNYFGAHTRKKAKKKN